MWYDKKKRVSLSMMDGTCVQLCDETRYHANDEAIEPLNPFKQISKKYRNRYVMRVNTQVVAMASVGDGVGRGGGANIPGREPNV